MWVATDLHAHSLFSDGTASPEAVVESRAAASLAVIALSDHDVLAGVRRAAVAASRLGLRLLPAMEATAFFHFGQSQAEQVHILAYFPPRLLLGHSKCSQHPGGGEAQAALPIEGDLERSPLEDGLRGSQHPGGGEAQAALPIEGDLERSPLLEQTFLYRRGLRVQARWRDFICTWLDGLHIDDRRAIAGDGAGDDSLHALPADHFPGLQILIQRIVARRPQVFRHFIRSHVRFWQDDRELFGWSPDELIDAIRADGAIDIVAHPARYRDKARLARLLLGASGVEAYTSRHRPEWAAQFRAFAEAHGKLWTASTDDHQKPDTPYVAPASPTPAYVVEQLLDEPLPKALLCGPTPPHTPQCGASESPT